MAVTITGYLRERHQYETAKDNWEESYRKWTGAYEKCKRKEEMILERISFMERNRTKSVKVPRYQGLLDDLKNFFEPFPLRETWNMILQDFANKILYWIIFKPSWVKIVVPPQFQLHREDCIDIYESKVKLNKKRG